MHRCARLSVPAFGTAMLLAVLWTSPVSAQMPEFRDASSGVYTEEQAAAGEEVFKSICSECHKPGMPIWGTEFQGRWMTGRSLWNLYEFISLSMPGERGGTLDEQQYLDVVTYLLKINGYPAGQTPLPDTMLDIAPMFDIAPIILDPPPGPTIVPNPETTSPTER